MKTLSYFLSSLFFFSLISFNASCQINKFKVADLLGNTWRLQGLSNMTNDMVFDVKSITIIFNDKDTTKFEYYLSDSITKLFDTSKVGISTEGKYIVRRPLLISGKQNLSTKVSNFEILELNSETLVLKNEKQQKLEYLLK